MNGTETAFQYKLYHHHHHHHHYHLFTHSFLQPSVSLRPFFNMLKSELRFIIIYITVAPLHLRLWTYLGTVKTFLSP